MSTPIPNALARWRGTVGSRGQAGVEALLIVVALAVAAAGLGLFGPDGGLAQAWTDALRGFHRGFVHALSLPT